METVTAIALFALLLIGGWIVYLRTGARRWTLERDPLGEPPVKTVGAVVLAVVLVGFLTGGGSGAGHPGSMAQGLSDDDTAFMQAAGADDPTAVPAAEAAAPVDAAAGTLSPAEEAGDVPTRTPSTKASGEGYADLVVRAYEASARRGAESTWYPALAAEAERAAARRR